MIILVVASYPLGDFWKLFSFIVYGTSLILMYTASTLYHMARDPRTKRGLKILDHASIYLLIAGSYTPFLLVNMRSTFAWWIFILIWTIALAGVVFKLFYIGRFRRFSLFGYLTMGWLAIITLPKLIDVIHINGIWWMLAGGLFYTFGTIFYVWHKLRFHHAIWHLFVLAGSIAHFFAILYYVLPYQS